VNFAAFQTV